MTTTAKRIIIFIIASTIVSALILFYSFQPSDASTELKPFIKTPVFIHR